MVGMQGSMDYKGSDFTASLTAANTDIVNSSGKLSIVINHINVIGLNHANHVNSCVLLCNSFKKTNLNSNFQV